MKSATPLPLTDPHWRVPGTPARASARPLPMSRREMDDRGWEACDIVLITGDAYVDHPSFGVALIGRVLEWLGYRVGIIAQPDPHDVDAFRVLGPPRLCWGVSAGNLDSQLLQLHRDAQTAQRRCLFSRRQDRIAPGERHHRLYLAARARRIKACRWCWGAWKPRCAVSPISITGRRR